jgi:hypothetical protein
VARLRFSAAAKGLRVSLGASVTTSRQHQFKWVDLGRNCDLIFVATLSKDI